jgi:hypothetical protein
MEKNDFEKYDLIEIMKKEENLKDSIESGNFRKKKLSSKEEVKLLEVIGKYKDNWGEIEKQLGKS